MEALRGRLRVVSSGGGAGDVVPAGDGADGPQTEACEVCGAERAVERARALPSALYRCPRCQTRYCSVACYQRHSGACTNQFHAERNEEMLGGLRATDEDRRRVMAMLRRVDAGDALPDSPMSVTRDDGDADGDDGADGVPTEESILRRFQSLSVEEQMAELQKHVEPWRPWWLPPEIETSRRKRPSKITVLGDTSDERDPELAPPIPDLPALRTLTSRAPAPTLPFALVSVVAAVAAMLRIYNGDWTVDPREAAALVRALSTIAGCTRNSFDSLGEALDAAIAACHQPTLALPAGFARGVLSDTELILSDKMHVLRLLADGHRLFGSAGAAEQLPEKRLYFFLVWANEQASTVFAALAAGVAERRQLITPAPVNAPGKRALSSA